MDKQAKLKAVKKKMIKSTIYFCISLAYLGFVIFIANWDKTKGGRMGWYFFTSILFLIIFGLKLMLAITERKMTIDPQNPRYQNMRR